MKAFDIPGLGRLELEHLVLDYNGTIAHDGAVLPEAVERMAVLAQYLSVHVITADTFGSVRLQLQGLHCQVAVLAPGNQAEAKRNYIRSLGAQRCAAMGNGRNDRLMLAEAALGIAILGHECMSVAAMTAADIVAASIADALDLLLHPLRLTATLRE
ncbi:MAG: ATPase P [Desulfocurvibacter africanus]